MTQRYEYSLSLRIHHPLLDPREISRALRMRPKIAWRVGEPRLTPRGEPLPGVRSETYWSKALTPRWVKVPHGTQAEAKVIALMKRLRGQTTFLGRLRRTGGRIEIWLSSYSTHNYSFVLPAALIASISKLGCVFIVDVYPYKQRSGGVNS
jgi:hypothetical protein